MLAVAEAVEAALVEMMAAALFAAVVAVVEAASVLAVAVAVTVVGVAVNTVGMSDLTCGPHRYAWGRRELGLDFTSHAPLVGEVPSTT